MITATLWYAEAQKQLTDALDTIRRHDKEIMALQSDLSMRVDALRMSLREGPGLDTLSRTDTEKNDRGIMTKSSCSNGYVVGIIGFPMGVINSGSRLDGATKSAEVICKPLNVGN